MLAATAYPFPFPPPYPQTGYQPNSDVITLSDADRQRDLQRKRTYLSLLPPAQIIEICLNFEQYVPLHIRPMVWPTDLDAAIQALQKTSHYSDPPKGDVSPQQQQRPSLPPAEAPSTPASSANVASQQVHPPGVALPAQAAEASFPARAPSPEKPSTPKTTPPAVTAHDLDRTRSPIPSLPTSAQPQTEPGQTPEAEPATTTEVFPAPPTEPALTTSTTAAQVSPASQAQAPTSQQDATPATEVHTSTSETPAEAPAQASATQASGQTPTPVPPSPYPYAPYGYPLQLPYVPPPGTVPQAAYPHAPYYPPPGAPSTGYTSQYPGYPPYPPPAHPYPSNTRQNTQQPPPPPPQTQGEDLPSYEDMIVEALSEIGDPDGAAPKDIFTWIGTRWPLQMNFRPSASQALQKAFRRGRLEKRSGGRYRLNPTWEGGATSKRATRRPQTLAQTTYALHHPPPQQNASPFTHTPLPHRAHTSTPPPAPPPQHQPYPGFAYPYAGYGAYLGYPPYPGHAKAVATTFKTTFQSKDVGKSNSSGKGKDNASDEASGAWEAAQHILQAINFGSLQNNASQLTTAAPSSGGSSSAAPAMASLDFGGGASSQTIAVGEDGLGRATLTDEERASLQAQLALLAAQLTEIAHEEAVPSQPLLPPGVSPAEHARPESQPQQPHHPCPPQPPAAQPQQPLRPPPVITQASSTHAVLMDVNQFPDSSLSTFVGVFQVQTQAQAHTPPKPSTPSQKLPSRTSSQAPSQAPPQSAMPLPPSASPPTPTSPPPQDEPALQPTAAAKVQEVTLAVQPTVAVQAQEKLVAAPTPPDAESDEDEDMEMVDVDSFMEGVPA